MDLQLLTRSLDGEIAYLVPPWLFEKEGASHPGPEPLHLVLTPGKVASKTIAATLANHFGLDGVVHTHFIGTYGQRVLDSLIYRTAKYNVWENYREIAVLLQRELEARRSRDPGTPQLFVFSAVRDPIAQAISVVFECWWMFADAPELLTEDIVCQAVIDMSWAQMCQGWYDSELREVTGVDLWAEPFPSQRGWNVYETSIARVVLLRFENFGCIRDALWALYGKPFPGEVLAKNLTSAKPHADHYRLIRARLRLPVSVVEDALSLRYVRHFYLDAELQAFREQWLRWPS